MNAQAASEITSPSVRDTKSEILRLAESLMVRHGYQGFSYADIATPLGIKKAAVHYHFPSKEDLGLAVIERYRDILEKATSEFMQRGGDPIEQIEGYFGFSLEQSRSLDAICPIGALSVEFLNLPDSMKKGVNRLLSDTVEWLTRALVLGREKGVLHFEGDPETKALSLLASVQGARQLRRTFGEGALERTVELLRREMKFVTP